MSESILTSTKKVLGIAEEYTAFDDDIVMHINSVFSVLQQMGVGPSSGFTIEDSSTEWSEYLNGDKGFDFVRTYMALRVRLLFDPPTTSFMIDALNKQIEELEYRISAYREWLLNPVDPKTLVTSEEGSGDSY